MLSALSVFLGMAVFGYSNTCWKPLLNDYRTAVALLLRSITSVMLFTLIYIAITHFPVPRPLAALALGDPTNTFDLTKSSAAILLSLAGLYFFIESMRFTATGISGVIICLSSMLSALTGWWWLNEPFHVSLAIAFPMAFGGVLLLDNWDSWQNPSVKGIAFSLASATCWALANYGFKKGIGHFGVIPFSILQESIVLLVSAAFVAISRRKNEGNIRDFAVLGGITVLGVLFCNLGLNQLSLTLFSLMVLVQPLATLLFARYRLHERLTFKQIAGILLILCGVSIGLSGL